MSRKRGQRPEPRPGQDAAATGPGEGGGAQRGRRKPARGAMESLLRIVHTLEACAMVFGALASWGVSRDWPQPVGFAVVILLLVASMPLLARPWGWIVSLVLQGATAALALLEPMWVIVAAVFVILWIYCFVKARGIERDRRRAGLDPYGPPGA